MRQKYLSKLITDAPKPLLWAITAQPSLQGTGWKLKDSMPDGCIYQNPYVGLASLRGVEDAAGRRWLTLSVLTTHSTKLEVLRQLRVLFFPEKAIVALAIPAIPREEVEMWWSIDGDGLPCDEGWRQEAT